LRNGPYWFDNLKLVSLLILKESIYTTTPTSFLTKVPKIYDGEKIACSTNVAGKSGYPSARNWD
jgi:hypothetical protein